MRPAAPPQNEHHADRTLFLASVLLIGAVFAIGVTAQSVIVLGIDAVSIGQREVAPGFDVGIRIAVNLVCVALLAFGSTWLHLFSRSLGSFFLFGTTTSCLAAAIRTLLQLTIGVYDDLSTALSDALITAPVCVVVLLIARALVMLNRKARTAEQAHQRAAIRAAEALTSLQQEELRVRREVADALHGTMQQRLVLLSTELESIATDIKGFAPETGVSEPTDSDTPASRIRRVRTELDSMREEDLRTLSAALYPEALDRGLIPATRALTARIPASIPVQLFTEGFPSPDNLDASSRLLLVRVAEEGVTNALRHGKAASISIDLTHDSESGNPTYGLSVRHRGVPPKKPINLSGLARLRRRLTDLGGDLQFASEDDGARLVAWIPEPR
ncbi:sensor histidine kinase [Leucobacter denitrificans]|uniref:histidine kinase n=1 Tax=Leucobacter denitrificans TaxID=683042 RepID=A0A7G9S443_9MICO|nr:hypothetical protein [Leucobacter denitrificans]QNN62618.1 hypothetical protein H9L06_10335 [Leucobacter denitrificans]